MAFVRAIGMRIGLGKKVPQKRDIRQDCEENKNDKKIVL